MKSKFVVWNLKKHRRSLPTTENCPPFREAKDYDNSERREESRTRVIAGGNFLVLSILTIGIWSYILGATSVFCQVSEEIFIYDSMRKRDPFIPLLDPDSSTGIRIEFAPPAQRIGLPLEITLRGILQRGKERYAIINDDVVQEGDNMGDVKIKRIEKDRVIVGYREREFVIFLRKE